MKLVWLSHPLSTDTPLYAGEKGISIQPVRAMASGDSCNTSHLSLPSHAGSHVDAPRHFLADGVGIDHYPPEHWWFSCPLLVDVTVAPGGLIGPEALPTESPDDAPDDAKVDLLLLRTGFERHRGEVVYWQDGPGLAPALAQAVRDRYPAVRALGLDGISIASLRHRETGRIAHRAFLELDILLLEDLSLRPVTAGERLVQVMALPLRVVAGDGAPCTIVGWLEAI